MSQNFKAPVKDSSILFALDEDGDDMDYRLDDIVFEDEVVGNEGLVGENVRHEDVDLSSREGVEVDVVNGKDSGKGEEVGRNKRRKTQKPSVRLTQVFTQGIEIAEPEVIETDAEPVKNVFFFAGLILDL